MAEATALIDFLDAVAMRSGGVVLALCALSLIMVALSKGWLYGRRYVELLVSLIERVTRLSVNWVREMIRCTNTVAPPAAAGCHQITR